MKLIIKKLEKEIADTVGIIMENEESESSTKKQTYYGSGEEFTCIYDYIDSIWSDKVGANTDGTENDIFFLKGLEMAVRIVKENELEKAEEHWLSERLDDGLEYAEEHEDKEWAKFMKGIGKKLFGTEL